MNRKDAIRDLARLSQEMGVYDEFIETEEAPHPNRARFGGVLTLIDVPSDTAPSGSCGHRVILTKSVAQAALPSLIGMGVNFSPDARGMHNTTTKHGVIMQAAIYGQQLLVWGHLYGWDFPEIIQEIQQMPSGSFGMSYELAKVNVVDMRQKIWSFLRVVFTGAAILRREKAAYKQTEFRLLDSAESAQVAMAASEEQPKGESE